MLTSTQIGEAWPIGFSTSLDIWQLQNTGVPLANVCPTGSLKEEEESILKLETRKSQKEEKFTKKIKKYKLGKGTLG